MLDARGSLLQHSAQLHTWLMNSALPVWWRMGADHERGGFHEALDPDGRPTRAPRRARVQARQSYVFARAGTFGWAGPWEEAAIHGVRHLQERYLRHDGLYATLAAADGSILVDTPMVYDQSFILLALAWLHHTLGGSYWRERATNLLDTLKTRGLSGGGFIETGTRPYLSNPNMHLFEAALAWCAFDPDPRWFDLAHNLGTFALSKLLDPTQGFVREYYESDWSPGQGSEGRVVEPGHQFEWAWLLVQYSKLHEGDGALAAARKLFDVAERGIVDGVAIDLMSDDLCILSKSARLWPQTEWIKAALALEATVEIPDQQARYLTSAVNAIKCLLRFLDTPVAGLWRDRLLADGRFVDEPSPASSFYHIATAICELRECNLSE
jgi:mannose-6-phosphate isomerase